MIDITQLIQDMTMADANRIRQYKTHSTYRSLALKYAGVDNPLVGRMLAEHAAAMLLGCDTEELYNMCWTSSPDDIVSKDHEHALGGCYWWE
jgi:hypothetical protein